MRLWPQVIVIAIVLAVVSALVLGEYMGIFAATGFGLVVGVVTALVPTVAWKDRWAMTFGGWTTGSSEERIRAFEATERQLLKLTLFSTAFVTFVLTGLWLSGASLPTAKLLILLSPVLVFAAEWLYTRSRRGSVRGS